MGGVWEHHHHPNNKCPQQSTPPQPSPYALPRATQNLFEGGAPVRRLLELAALTSYPRP